MPSASTNPTSGGRLLPQARQGTAPVRGALTTSVGLHGERITWVGQRCQLYFLGNGARSYDPECGRFLSQDPFSPFSIAGTNSYAYCLGDPVNRSDPSGYVSAADWFGIALAVLGIVLSLATFGVFSISLLPVGLFLAVSSLALGVTAGVYGIVSILVKEVDPVLSRALGWTTLGLSIASILLGLPMPLAASYVKLRGHYIKGVANGYIKNNFSPKTIDKPAIDFLFATNFKQGSLVVTHGKPGILQGYNGEYMPVNVWANELASMEVYRLSSRHTPLYLMSCHAAKNGAHANAALLAERLNREVFALGTSSLYGIHRFDPARGFDFLFFDANLGGVMHF
mgnify:FL=1